MLKKEMPSKYNPKSVEKGKYSYWRDSGFFTSGDKSKTPYTIVIPPPNVTGRLHIGHAWDTTIQDILIRRKRMQGYDALWLPGMDHAGIATQAKVDAKLKEQGLSRYDLGREKFLDIAWEWKDEYAGYIREQWAALGLSVDYRKERFTLDDGLANAVSTVFIKLFEEGLIYRGERIINWDSQAKTALSNVEVEYHEIEGSLYHIIYPFVDESGGLVVATTRPETMFGDVAVMVNPNDQRYQKYLGKHVYIPNTNRQIPVITDEYVELNFGTGVVKVTPAHDPNDFEVGNRHQLERIICMNEDGTMNNMAGIYEGLDRFDCRQKVVADLKKENLCQKIEKIIHSVGHSERTGVIVESRLSKQWFVKMEPLALDVLKMQESNQAINFIPARFNKTLTSWLDLNNIQDWCISRQLWWGHRIPAWYKDDEIKVSKTSPGSDWIQDEDVLDTWFSSALWPFSTLGWPENSDDLQRYFPIDCLVCGYDIIFFWVARMAFQSKHFLGQRPFKDCFIHGLIRDEDGRKMSKSLGNGVDPFDLIDQYGCDSMRYFLSTNATPGQDLRFSDEKMSSSWNYINKIWNIARFIQMNLNNCNYQDEEIDIKLLTSNDYWIIKMMNETIKNVDMYFDRYELGEVARCIYNFTWDNFASWYLEMTKVVFSGQNNYLKINTCAILKLVLTNIVKLLHPIMPFVTEEIYQHFHNNSIMISQWPEQLTIKIDSNIIDNTTKMYDIISATRTIRNEKNVPLSKKITVLLEIHDNNLKMFLQAHNDYLEKFINFDNLIIDNQIETNNSIITVLTDVKVIIPLKELINLEDEIARLRSQEEKLLKEVERSKGMLSNPNFISKAPEDKIILEREKLINYQNNLMEIQQMIAKMEQYE